LLRHVKATSPYALAQIENLLIFVAEAMPSLCHPEKKSGGVLDGAIL
jgi:hypothetical protein